MITIEEASRILSEPLKLQAEFLWRSGAAELEYHPAHEREPAARALTEQIISYCEVLAHDLTRLSARRSA